MPSENGGDGTETKRMRLENPSGWIRLTRYETVRLLIDALLEAPPDYQFNKSELERRTGVSREAIRDHLPLLVNLGVVEEVEAGEWPEYRLNDDGKVTRELFELNTAVNSVLSGESKNVTEETIPNEVVENLVAGGIDEWDQEFPTFRRVDNATRETDDDLIDRPPASAYPSNAD